MIITMDDQCTQHEPNDSIGTQHYPTTLYTPPVFNTGNPEIAGHRMLHTDLRFLYECVRDGDSEWAPAPNLIKRLRELAPHKGEKGHDGKPTREATEYENIKKYRLTFSVPGHYQPGHRHSPDPQKPSGNPKRPSHADHFIECQQYGAHAPVSFASYKYVELDNLDTDKLAAERDRLKAHPSVIAVWLSAGGRGFHIFVRMDTAPTNDAEAHAAYEVVVHELGIADSVANDKSVKNLARLAFISYDPDAWWNPNPAPLAWEKSGSRVHNGDSPHSGESESQQRRGEARKSTRTKKSASEGRESSPGGSDKKTGCTGSRAGHDASATLVNRALEAMIAGKAGENDNHLLAVMGNMKAMGMGFDEFDTWAAAAGCTCERRPRWDNPPQGNQSNTPGWAIVNLAAKHYESEYRNGNGTGNQAHGTKAGGNGRGNSKTNQNGSAPHSPPPAPGWDGLTPVYQAAWLAYVAHEALVVVWDPEARERDGAITYRLYAVDEDTGRLECGPLMTGHRIAAAQAYLGACLDLEESELVACVKHARSMRVAKTAAIMAENVGSSRTLYPKVWNSIPFHTPQELDADLSVISTPAGVWSIPEHRYLSADEARPKLCSATIRWDYDSTAAHPLALTMFESLYGDLQDTTTREFARWRHAATALVRRPEREIIVKISKTGSAKTTEGNLQQNAFSPLVVKGERAAIEQSGGYNSGGASHNSYLADFARPARRVNIPEASSDDGRQQKPFDSQQLRDRSESATITYRDPGPNPRITLPYDAHLFIDGNVPEQGQDLLRIAGSSDGAEAIKDRLRGSPYAQIPKDQQRGDLRDYGNPNRARNKREAADIADFNRTVVRLMFDGMAQHWAMLLEVLPQDDYSSQVVEKLKNRGKARWVVEWLPHVLRPTVDCEEDTHTFAIFSSYLAWHDENGEGKPAARRKVTDAVLKYYGVVLGARCDLKVGERKIASTSCIGWTLAS